MNSGKEVVGSNKKVSILSTLVISVNKAQLNIGKKKEQYITLYNALLLKSFKFLKYR